MYDMSSKYGCGWDPEPYCDDKKREECDIKSECCNGFVKEQFTLNATATQAPVVVYESSNEVFTRATIKVKNLSPTLTINVQSQNINRDIGPNQEFVFSANLLNVVQIKTTTPGRARVILCFDLQFSSPEGCCPIYIPAPPAP